jgi:hypothetical protein
LACAFVAASIPDGSFEVLFATRYFCPCTTPLAHDLVWQLPSIMRVKSCPMVFQYNLISFCVRNNKKRVFLMKLATFNFSKKFVNQHLYIQQDPKNMGGLAESGR